MTRKRKSPGGHLATADTDANNGTSFARFSLARAAENSSPNVTDAAHRHPALRGMFRTVEAMLDRGEPHAWALLGALATINGCASFRRDFDRAAIEEVLR